MSKGPIIPILANACFQATRGESFSSEVTHWPVTSRVFLWQVVVESGHCCPGVSTEQVSWKLRDHVVTTEMTKANPAVILDVPSFFKLCTEMTSWGPEFCTALSYVLL